jgi:hypothetical protein
MNTRANTFRFAASFRQLAGVLSILLLLAGLLPSHADARILTAERGAIDSISLQSSSEDLPNRPDSVPCHIACQCSCSSTVLPEVMEQSTPLLVRPIRFAMGAAPFLPFAPQAPPSKPPRI